MGALLVILVCCLCILCGRLSVTVKRDGREFRNGLEDCRAKLLQVEQELGNVQDELS